MRKLHISNRNTIQISSKLSLVRWALSLSLLATMPIAGFSATYYIDYVNGSDSNPGTSKAAPWKHCPAMQPFSGTYSHAAGDRFIFKGGVTWPNAALPLLITQGGTSENPDYYGVDPNWHTGTSFKRPVFNAGGKAFANHSGNRGNVVWINGAGASDVIIDNFEITGYVWSDPVPTSNSDGFAVYVQSADRVIVQNVYAHNWIVRTTTDAKFGGFGASDSSGSILSNCLVVAPTTVDAEYISDSGGGRTSGCGVIGFHTVDGNEFVGTTQGIWGGRVVRNNIVRDGQNSYDGSSHENGAWIQNDALFYNNVICNVGEGVGAFFLPGWGSRANRKLYVFNNVFFNTPKISLAPDNNPDQSNELWFFNNIVRRSTSCIHVGSSKNGAPFGKLVIQNNIFISENKYSNPSDVVAIIDANDLGANYWNSNNVVYTAAEATAAGLLQATLYEPQHPLAALVDKGVDFSGISSVDKKNRVRPAGSAWDIGAYEFYSGTTSLPTSPSGISATAASSTRINVSWTDNSANEGGFMIERSLTSGSGFVQVGIVGANITTYADQGLPPATRYYYRVRAFNTAGFSAYTSTASAVTTTPNAGNPPGVMISAVDGIISAPFELTQGYISQPIQTTDLTGGRAVYSFNVTAADEYLVIAVVDTDGEDSNSFFVNVDEEPLVPQSVWHVPVTDGFELREVSWQGSGTSSDPQLVPKYFYLEPGTHHVIVRGREKAAKLASISLIRRSSPPPPGNLRIVIAQ